MAGAVVADKKMDCFFRLQIFSNDEKIKEANLSIKPLPKGTATAANAQKKKLNIPVCDVSSDALYAKNVKDNFSLPSTNIYHLRKIGEDGCDISTDYCIDEEDEKWIAARAKQYDKETAKTFSKVDVFETIINILERHTGFSKEPIVQAYAQRFVTNAFPLWSTTTLNKIFPEVYRYWCNKRSCVPSTGHGGASGM